MLKNSVFPAVFDRFLTDVRDAARGALTAEERNRRVLLAMRAALVVPEFRAACARLAAAQIVELSHAWRNPAIHDEPEFSVHLIYWPPHFACNPHKHRSWTVTGVLHNEITTNVFEHDETGDIASLEPSRSYRGAAGHVGHIIPPCIHNVVNHTDQPSITLHVFATSDPQDTIWYEIPTGSNVIEGGIRAASQFLVSAALANGGDEPLGVLETLYKSTDPYIRFNAARGMTMVDIEKGRRLLAELAETLPERGRDRILALLGNSAP